MKAKVQDELKQHFRPEFLNRVDDIVVFHQLTEDEIIEIVDLMLAKVDERLQGQGHGHRAHAGRQGRCSPSKGYDPVLGARPLRRTIQREIEDILSEKILFGELAAGPDRGRRRRGRSEGAGTGWHTGEEVHLPRRSPAGPWRTCAGRGRWISRSRRKS